MIRHTRSPILYVDDTVEQRYAMRRILETEGFDVLEAGRGYEALALAQENISLAVIDVRLPDMSGYDLSHQIKERKPHLPVLQVSASFSDPVLRTAGFSGGADAYIAQPVHPSELVSLIRRMLITSEAEEALRFLAAVGPRLTSTLSLPAELEVICNAMTPQFTNRCTIYLSESARHPGTFWPEGPPARPDLYERMRKQATEECILMLDSRCIIAPLLATERSLGAIAFELNQDREYTATDCILASDLASRCGLALQNCILFTSEQATRSALIQAEKLATAGRMSAAISHEINNPLEALTNLLYIIECSPEGTPSIKEIAKTALGEVERLAHITRQSLGFYRELRTPTTLNLSQSVSDTVDLYKKRIIDKQIDLRLDLDPSILMLGIKGEIRQVISNLLVNAMEATHEGGQINVTTSTRDNLALLTIKDNGPGIRKEHLERIFEPFFSTKQGTGTGLGLWITESIIEKHEGKVHVTTQSEPQNHGTAFEIEFPLEPATV